MFSDTDHSINRDFVTSHGDRLFDRIEERDVVLFGHGTGEIPIRELINVHGSQRQCRPDTTVLLPTFQDLADQNIGVQTFLVGR